jgi:hypothetical protein
MLQSGEALRAVKQHSVTSDAELSDCTRHRRPERGTAEGCVRDL